MIKAKASISTERDPIRMSGFRGDAVKVLLEINLDDPVQFLELKNLIGTSFNLIMSTDDLEIT